MFRGSVLGNLVLAILIAIMAVAVGAYLFGFDMPGDDEAFSRDGPRLVALIALLIVIGLPMLMSRHKWSNALKSLALWALFGVLLVTGYAYRDELTSVGQRVLATVVPGTAITSADGTITVIRGPANQYRVAASVNDADVDFLFDTGASAVTLTQADARAAGLSPEQLSYTVPVATANGEGRVAAVRIETLEIGGFRLNHVRAFVAREEALDTSLLGLSAIDRFSSWRVEGDRLILQP